MQPRTYNKRSTRCSLTRKSSNVTVPNPAYLQPHLTAYGSMVTAKRSPYCHITGRQPLWARKRPATNTQRAMLTDCDMSDMPIVHRILILPCDRPNTFLLLRTHHRR